MDLIIGGLILFFIIRRQLKEREMTAKLYVMPVILLLYSFYGVSKLLTVGAGDWMILIMSFFIAFAAGMIQGRFASFIYRDGRWYVSGSPASVATWMLSIPIKYGLTFIVLYVFHLNLHLQGLSSYVTYLFSISGILLGRYTMLMLRHPVMAKDVLQNEQHARRVRETS
ncbi:uncharacterized membrane protein YjjP (DUF1212 family) [Scopulibacillus daqui]|uniref:Uncharacterized membrane protein YjjP (DUF1212 family) n=1 Tax=Scopulibacillus daqui TaxID=1469162 RepID=A0ABS2Q1K2_9BACL|nr:hypothetical protein [Scopulibacillus daqui]MBM7645735.1 uncharacterized membrane protein YjjP (DUF1212 family) [Scopulibacillus daqui]